MPTVATFKESECQYFMQTFKVKSIEEMRELLYRNFGVEELRIVADFIELPAKRFSLELTGGSNN